MILRIQSVTKTARNIFPIIIDALSYRLLILDMFAEFHLAIFHLRLITTTLSLQTHILSIIRLIEIAWTHSLLPLHILELLCTQLLIFIELAPDLIGLHKQLIHIELVFIFLLNFILRIVFIFVILYLHTVRTQNLFIALLLLNLLQLNQIQFPILNFTSKLFNIVIRYMH